MTLLAYLGLSAAILHSFVHVPKRLNMAFCEIPVSLVKTVNATNSLKNHGSTSAPNSLPGGRQNFLTKRQAKESGK